MANPKWAKPERQTCLVKLWVNFGNKCLQGHSVCPNPDHYLLTIPKAEITAKAVKVMCRDRQGNPLRDSQGNPIYLETYALTKAIREEVKVIRLYDKLSEDMIADWIADDRRQAEAEWEAERKAIHRLGERRYPLRGQFSAIAKDIFFARQPPYYLEGLGVSGLTFKPFAMVRIASSSMRLMVDLGDTLRGVSKNKRRKAIRYGEPLPKEIQDRVDELARQAVAHWWST